MQSSKAGIIREVKIRHEIRYDMRQIDLLMKIETNPTDRTWHETEIGGPLRRVMIIQMKRLSFKMLLCCLRPANETKSFHPWK